MLKQNVYLLPENLIQLKIQNIGLEHTVCFFYLYLLQLIVRLTPDFNCCNSFAL